ncbi:ankyrin repeat domain-containing protein [Alloacidobacterium sp.]|uniref:ankyrin repeat domain-containing protein n=1 Tax=Alloacidobacterium sp. TaxID=2951999 RepID=UPI002D2436B5|nr:ankyrin repeat domain-containing protein [Alloacidobacterium sp.]HYK37259.1 ankyrin repeat domain-containing protein [Alloacidobacterium sp.]
MSRTLPQKSNLEHLRKQAKALLHTMPQGKLADAQHALANEYGFATWAELKSHVITQGLSPAEALKAAVCDSDAHRVRQLLESHPELRAKINEPLADYGFGQQALYAAVQRGDRATIDVLLNAGADIRKRTDWWAGGFGVLDDCDPGMVDFLVERGAVIDAHAAARLGMMTKLAELVTTDPSIVHAKGGDGQTPLHFASTVEIAKFLLDHGADINALDVDHESTPAQYMLRVEQKRHYPHDRQDVARYLVTRGCRTDILMAAALDDADLVRRHLDNDPACIRMSVSEEWFPKRNPRAGGTIYIWQLGWHRTAHTVARDFGHEDVFQLLMERTPEELKLALACELGDEAVFQKFLAKNPDAARSLSEDEKRKLPNAAQNNNTKAVRLMLEAGWPVNTPGDAGATALHWAGFHGNAGMAREILRFHPNLELKSRDYAGTALSWTIYGSGNGWHRDTGDYVRVVSALLVAGATVPPHAVELEPSDAVLEMLP